MMGGLSHFDDKGAAHMVDVSAKAVTSRTAIARGHVSMLASTLQMVEAGTNSKGDVLSVARLAGIMAAKRTADLIPLCHPLALTSVAVDLETDATGIGIEARVTTSGQTGVEMEALTAVSVAALTVYDMLKAVDRGMVISEIRLTFKDGGKSGTYRAP